MSTEIKKGVSFVKQVVAKLKGDDNEVLAEKISRKAISAVDSQIAALNAKIVDLETEKENAEEKLNEAMYPTTMITDNKYYCDNIVRAQSAVDVATENLENAKESLVYFKALLAKF